jgi:hypothetical protein
MVDRLRSFASAKTRDHRPLIGFPDVDMPGKLRTKLPIRRWG